MPTGCFCLLQMSAPRKLPELLTVVSTARPTCNLLRLITVFLFLKRPAPVQGGSKYCPSESGVASSSPNSARPPPESGGPLKDSHLWSIWSISGALAVCRRPQVGYISLAEMMLFERARYHSPLFGLP